MSLVTIVDPYTAAIVVTPTAGNGITLHEDGDFALSSDREWFYSTDDVEVGSMVRVAPAEVASIRRDGADVSLYLRTRAGAAQLAVAFSEIPEAAAPGGGGGVSQSGTETLTNKRITRRVVALVDAATVTPNADTTDMGKLATVSQATLLANASGTPTDGQLMEWRITSAAVKALTFGNKYAATSIAIPTATAGGGQTERWLWEWSAAASLWYLIAYNAGA